MYSLFLNSPFTDQLTQALCWTFIHSLWQGLVLALMAASLVQFAKRSGAVLRYYLLSALFFLFIVTSLVTFFREFKSLNPANTSRLAVNMPAAKQSVTVVPAIASQITNRTGLSMVEKGTDFLNVHATVIVLLWFVLFCTKSLQMLVSIGYIQRLRFYKTQRPPLFWKNKIKELADQMKIKRMVLLLESGIIKVPVVIGFLKPVLLMPIGLLANLPTDEIEAILLHELAHIQRQDYFINLLQSFIEVVFFFNPALLWISSLIKEERENCCDDIAITVTNNKATFIQALISFQEFNSTVPVYGMAFGDGKNHVLNRVKRIILNKNKTLNTMEKTLFAGSIAAIVLLTFSPVKKIFSFTTPQNGNKESGIFQTTKSSSQIDAINTSNQPSFASGLVKGGIEKWENASPLMDTVPAPSASQVPLDKPDASQNDITNFFSSINRDGTTTTIWMEATSTDGKKYKIKKVNNQITALYIDGVKIADEHINDYQAVIDRIETVENDHLKETAKESKTADNYVQQKDHKKRAEDIENQKKDIDFDKINLEIKEALSKIDFQKINSETEKALKNIDWDKIKINVEKALKDAQLQIKNIDIEKIKKQIEQSQQKIKNENLKIDKEKINKQVDEAFSIARKQIENAKILNYKMDKQIEDALRIDRQQIQSQWEPE
jgi:beta-lactamase regulating signal transducer with metallopeptidase domain